MLVNKLVLMIQEHAEKLTENWIKEVSQNPSTKTYHNLSKEDLHDKVYGIYSQLGKWFDSTESNSEFAKHFFSLGLERKNQGLALSEVIFATILAKKNLIDYTVSQGLFDNALEMARGLEFTNRISTFFEKAIYFISLGYEFDVSDKKTKGLVEDISVSFWRSIVGNQS